MLSTEEVDEVRRFIRKGISEGMAILPTESGVSFDDYIGGYYGLSEEFKDFQMVLFYRDHLTVNENGKSKSIAYSDICGVIVPKPGELPEVVNWNSGYWTIDRAWLLDAKGRQTEVKMAVPPGHLRPIYFWTLFLQLLKKGVSPNKRRS
jgi:hypothetical protein